MNEEKFILNAARLDLSDENVTVLTAMSDKVDPDLLFRKAFFHGVTPLIYYSLKKHNLTQLLSADLFDKFKEHYHQTVLTNLKFIKKTNELSKILEEKIVLLKGAHLIHNFYPDIGIRSMSDIDVLVEIERADAVFNTLKSNGFVRQGPNRQSIITSTAKSTVHNKVVPFHHLDILSSDHCDIEIHTNLFEYHDFYYLTKEALKKAVLIKPDRNLYRLSNEFFLIHLCNHFFLHNYLHKQKGKNLRMLCDINEFILQRDADIDWDEINDMCSESEQQDRVSTVLTYANHFLQTPVPENFIQKDIINENLISIDCLANYNSPAIKKQRDNLNRFFFRLGKFDNPFEVFVFVFRTLFPASEWINNNFNTRNNTKGWLTGYFRYWSDLFTRYVLKL